MMTDFLTKMREGQVPRCFLVTLFLSLCHWSVHKHGQCIRRKV